MKRIAQGLVFLAGCCLLTMAFSEQGNFARILQEKLGLYYARHIPLKVHLTFNQPTYVPGDTAFYGIRLFTAEGHLPIEGRQILNVLLLNSEGEPVQRHRGLVTNGRGTNQLPLPEGLPSGIYTVAAFHPVMEGEDTDLFFQMPLYVVGPSIHALARPTPDLAFFPEGGNFVAGITNKVVAQGLPGASATVLQRDEQVASFELNDQGVGIFFLKPARGAEYQVRIKGQAEQIPLPTSLEDGAGLLVSVPLNRAPIRITVQVPESSGLRDEHLTLALTAQSRVYFTAAISLRQSNFVTLAFPQNDLPRGIAHLTLFAADGNTLAERLVYIADDEGPSAGIALKKQQFEVRERVPLSITLRDEEGKPVGGDVSVRVYREALSTTGIRDVRFPEFVDLWADVSDSRYHAFTEAATSRDDLLVLDQLLVTKEWKRFSWDDVWKEKLPTMPFRKFLHLRGNAHNSDGTPLPDSTMLTFFLQKGVMTYEVQVTPSGNFEFSLVLDFFGEEEFFYRAESRGKFLPNVQVTLHAEYSNLPLTPGSVETDIPDSAFADAQRRKQIDRSYQYHLHKPSMTRPPSLNALIEEEVFGADVVINFEDYYLFPTMSETLREIVPMLQHRRQKSRDVVRLFFDDRNRFAEEEPLFVIDGVITDNTTYFLGLNPADVVSIRVLNSYDKLSTFGAVGKNGMVLVETRIPGHAEQIPRSPYTFTAQGLTATTWRPDKPTPSQASRVPDLRTALYWNPAVRVDSTGIVSLDFNASDVTGRFRIEVEGFTDDGVPLFSEADIKVRFTGRP